MFILIMGTILPPTRLGEPYYIPVQERPGRGIIAPEVADVPNLRLYGGVNIARSSSGTITG
jgi:hypothetical protein